MPLEMNIVKCSAQYSEAKLPGLLARTETPEQSGVNERLGAVSHGSERLSRE